MIKSQRTVSLSRWVWKAYLKTALIPIVLIGIVIIFVDFSIHTAMIDKLSNYLYLQVQKELNKASNQDAQNIEQQLINISRLTTIYAHQTADALSAEVYVDSADIGRLDYSDSGVYYTKNDTPEGGAAVFYSGFFPVDEAEREKVTRVLATQQLMKDIVTQHPIVAQIYLNTFDSLNVIYPYFDVLSQYSKNIDITEFNFYYEADAAHNPTREAKWTDIYLDPAGQGWMASCIAPVYRGDFLEGVVGLDITVSYITQQVLNLDIPWGGYAMLIGSDGMILALPESGEKDWKLSELTEHHYAEAILQDTFKPDEFNLHNMENLSDLAKKIDSEESGIFSITLDGESKVVTWRTIDGTEWKLMFVLSERTILESANEMRSSEIRGGIILVGTLLLVYALFFLMLYMRAKTLSHNISSPLIAINDMVQRIGQGNYYQQAMEFGVTEFQDSSNQIVLMGQKHGEANDELLSTQEMLKSHEAYLQALINSIDDVVIEVDENGTFLNIRASDPNKLATAYAAAGKNNTIDSIMGEENAGIYLEVIRDAIQTGNPGTVEYQLETQQGVCWFQARIARIGGTKMVTVSARDITERKLLEHSIVEARNEAEKANQAKTKFLSSMSHELRTPLNAVMGFAQLLEINTSEPLSASQQEYVAEIDKAGKHLLDLINEVLDLAKIESGKATISLEPVYVSGLLMEISRMVLPMAEKAGITIQCTDCACGDFHVLADHVRIKQVLINLLSNAIKYNKTNGKVDFFCEQVDSNIRFHVIDTGIGIPSDKIKDVFEPFHRLKEREQIVEGTGIGLAVVKQLMDMMGGQVFLESELGCGSHFYVELPIAIPMKEGEGMPLDIIDANYIDKMKMKVFNVLYVEDNPANLSLINHVMKNYPFIHLLTANNGKTGIALAAKTQLDLVLLDINLPDMDGYELCRTIKSIEGQSKIKIIAVSANAMASDIAHAKDIGFDDYITKPIDIHRFIKIFLRNLFAEL